MHLNVHNRSIGVNWLPGGQAAICLWAPLASSAELILEQPAAVLNLKQEPYGYWSLVTDQVKPGARYRLSINQGDAYPDPASLSQPSDIHGASEAIDLHQYRWKDQSWRNRPLEQYIIYELHTGTFSPEHGFAGIIEKLDHLLELGITAIEIMPVSQFPGSRNWGYDGVYPFATQHSYGGAAALQQLVDACHEKGLAVILDVVYNHIGPEGNYLSQFGPYFTDRYNTPWGKAINFDDAWCEGVRRYFTENALMWFRDFHIDALRMDAVHAIKDFSPVHIVQQIREYTVELTAVTGRPYYLIAEMDLNNPVFINEPDKGGYGLHAQWIDEFHHALRVSSGQAREGYYSDFNGVADLAKSYTDAYVYDGQYSEHRKKFFGVKTDNPGKQFVVFSQNHDHTGNRMLGERTSQLVSADMCRLLLGAVLVSPYVPMLFMGEEWAETNPFLYFISHTDEELAALVNKGRKEEFSSFQWAGEPPDPRLTETFNRSCLQWDLRSRDPHAAMLRYYKAMILLRKTLPALCTLDRHKLRVDKNEKANTLTLYRWTESQFLICLMNFSNQVHDSMVHANPLHLLMDSSAREWGGTDPLQHVQHHGTTICVPPESILIFERR